MKLRLEEALEAIIDYRGKTPTKRSFGIPLITARIVKDGRIEEPDEFIAEEDYDQWMRRGLPKPGDVLITTEAPLGEVAQLDGRKVALAQRLICLRGRVGVLDNSYLKYLLMSPPLQDQLHSRGSGSTVTGIKQSELRKIELDLPDFETQVRVGQVLRSLDDKIELNRRMNETLEAMARTIFRSWFVDFDPVRIKARGGDPTAELGLSHEIAALFPDSFQDSELGEIPKGWRGMVIDELGFSILGGDWGKDEKSDTESESARCIRGADIPSIQSFDYGKMPNRFLRSSSLTKRKLAPWDVVVEISGGSPTQSTGRAILATDTWLDGLSTSVVASNFCRTLKPPSAEIGLWLYFHLRQLYDEDAFLNYENGTTGIKNLAFSSFCSIHRFVVPSGGLLRLFRDRVEPLLMAMSTNTLESRNLAETRDYLLPLLLSGKIEVSQVGHVSAEVDSGALTSSEVKDHRTTKLAANQEATVG